MQMEFHKINAINKALQKTKQHHNKRTMFCSSDRMENTHLKSPVTHTWAISSIIFLPSLHCQIIFNERTMRFICTIYSTRHTFAYENTDHIVVLRSNSMCHTPACESVRLYVRNMVRQVIYVQTRFKTKHFLLHIINSQRKRDFIILQHF